MTQLLAFYFGGFFFAVAMGRLFSWPTRIASAIGWPYVVARMIVLEVFGK